MWTCGPPVECPCRYTDHSPPPTGKLCASPAVPQERPGQAAVGAAGQAGRVCGLVDPAADVPGVAQQVEAVDVLADVDREIRAGQDGVGGRDDPVAGVLGGRLPGGGPR